MTRFVKGITRYKEKKWVLFNKVLYDSKLNILKSILLMLDIFQQLTFYIVRFTDISQTSAFSQASNSVSRSDIIAFTHPF